MGLKRLLLDLIECFQKSNKWSLWIEKKVPFD